MTLPALITPKWRAQQLFTLKGLTSMSKVLRSSRIAAGLFALSAASLLGMGTASAAPALSPIPQPSVNGVDIAGALPQQIAANGEASAQATNAIALAVTANGGTAVADAKNFSGPAAIAVGDNAHSEAWGVKPGLAIAIAGPNSTVRVTGDTPTECEGTWGFAGDFQTLTGCVLYPAGQNAVHVPLDARPLVASLSR